MDAERFDDLTKALGRPVSRRSALRVLVAGVVGGMLGLDGMARPAGAQFGGGKPAANSGSSSSPGAHPTCPECKMYIDGPGCVWCADYAGDFGITPYCCNGGTCIECRFCPDGTADLINRNCTSQ